jgi:hypothetical protein
LHFLLRTVRSYDKHTLIPTPNTSQSEGRREIKIDLYTKVVLTVIALALVGNLFRPVVMPGAAQAKDDGKFEYLIHFGLAGFFNTKTGDIWEYDYPSGNVLRHYKLVEVGQPLQKVK